jgi:hypothetical protein
MENLETSHLTLTCPFIGMRHDPKTSFIFPARGNLCYHCKSPAIPSLEHQGSFCINGAYTRCPIYINAKEQLFPAQFRIKESSQHKLDLRLLALFIGIVLFVFVIGQSGILGGIKGWSLVLIPAPTSTAFLQPIFSATTALPQPSAMPALATKTKIPTPIHIPTHTSTPTVTPQAHALDIPVQVEGRRFIIHRVLEGEGIEILAKNYATKPDVIRMLNYKIPPIVWANLAIVLLPGVQNVDPALPVFQAYQVVDQEITVEELAQKLNADAASLRFYNACPEICRLKAGDWLIVPHAK